MYTSMIYVDGDETIQKSRDIIDQKKRNAFCVGLSIYVGINKLFRNRFH